jgi:poly-gamma-glutamate capsule biosynthesis protein CapA/YwtB (metallophosphatase superfamily)
MKASFVGDIMLGRLVNDNLKKRPAEYLWRNTLPILQEADLLFGNLECVISDRGQPWSATPKAFHFRSDAKNIESLTKANFKALSLANNHILDFEYEAMQDTLEILNQAGIKHAGAGATFTEASKPAFLNLLIKKSLLLLLLIMSQTGKRKI